ncbi:MAG: hypothetical protein QUS35_12195 [bacterium]|nr:hypothetical protein [bacterium]
MKPIRVAVFSAWAAAAMAAGPDTFLAVHCEPTHTYLYPALVRLVALADSFEAKLTIEFNPQWADTILPDAGLLAQLRGWQASGHEIAAHHHGVSYGVRGWDGFTDRPPSDYPAPFRYRGDMAAYTALLDSLAGDSLLLTCCAPDSLDWPDAIPFRTEGHNMSECTAGFSFHTFDGREVIQLQHGLMNTESRLDSAKALYNLALPSDICGINLHEKDFNEHPSNLRSWLEFLQIRRKTVKTVSALMRERGYAAGAESRPSVHRPAGFLLSPVFPNPFNSEAVIRFQAPDAGRFRIDAIDVSGRTVRLIADGFFPAGTHEVRWCGGDWPAGVYCVRIAGDGSIGTRKAVLLK